MKLIPIIFIAISIFILAAAVFLYTSIPNLSPESDLQVSSQEKEITISLNNDGTSQEKILWKINILNPLTQFPIDEWGIQIPNKVSNIEVKDPSGIIPHEIENNFLTFQNSEPINSYDDYFFEISYTVNKNPILFEPFHLYKRTFTRFESDDKYSLMVIPPSSSNSESLMFNLEKGETKTIDLTFTTPDSTPNLETINSLHFSATIPKRYSSEYLSILEQADKGIEQIETLYGISSPHKWSIELINEDDIDFEEQTEGYYLDDGRVRIKSTHIRKSEIEILYTILHESTHGFNSEFFEERVPNSWWEEGTAQYISYTSLENLGYNTEELKSKNLPLTSTCNDEELEFIADWSPNINLNSKSQISCGEVLTSPLPFGYAYSNEIIESIADEYGPNIFKDFYKTSQNEKIQFSPQHSILNNQINYILSKTTGEDSSQLLNKYNLDVIPISSDPDYQEQMLTGLQIYEPLSAS